MAQYIVIGLGNFGSRVSVALSELGHEVLAMDIDAEMVDHVKDSISQAVIGDVTDKEALARLVNTDFAAAIISLGDKLEASVLSTLHLKELGIARIIAKANSEDHGKVLKAVGATEVIYPEQEVALTLAHRLHTPNLIEHIPLAPEYSIVEVVAPDDFVGKTLSELDLRRRFGFAVIAIRNVLSDTFDLAPAADIKIKPDSALIVIGKAEDLKKVNFGGR